MARIAVIPGDGAGVEVAREAIRLLDFINRERKLGLQFEHFDFGAERYLKTGIGLPPGQIDEFQKNYDAILFGAVGDPRVKDQAHAREILLGLRFGLDLYINFRPCKLYADRLSPLKGKGKKELDLIGAHELWRRTFSEVASEYPGIAAKHFYIDALAMQMVVKPETLEVIVTTNLFGDILTDLGAALTGGMGLAASANLNPDSTPLFEPVHGSAPDIAGKGLVNPCAMLLTSALMLSELGHGNEARCLEGAVEKALLENQGTPDVGGSLSTTQTADVILANLRELLRVT